MTRHCANTVLQSIVDPVSPRVTLARAPVHRLVLRTHLHTPPPPPLQYDGPEPLADVFGLTFSVDVERFGAIETVPLKPGEEERGGEGRGGPRHDW
mgnify:CR=1 FL=1